MASFTKPGLQRILIIAYVILVAASVIGRSAGDGVLDEAFWIKTLIGYAIAIVFVGAIALLLKKTLRPENALKPSVVQQRQSFNQSKNNCCNEVEDGIYEVVADEISTGSIQKAAWTQAFSEADGNDARAKAFYIKIRVRQLQRDAERNTQDRPPEDESVTDRVRLLMEKLGQIPYEDTDRISRDDFRGSRSSLLEPISVATASSISGLLAFQVIDLIKRGFIDGVYDGEEWYFELSPKRLDSQIDSGDAGKKSKRMFSAQNAGLDLADVELLKQRFGAKGSEELRAIIRDVNGVFWREEAREAALHLLQSRRKSNE